MNVQILYPSRPVLLVDDELQAIRGTAIALKSRGITNTIQCQDSRGAMDIVTKEQPDVIVMDLSMPGMSGEALLEQINRDSPDTPVIVATSTDELETAVRCMKNGAFDYLVKPMARERLVSAVKRAIEMRALRRECHELKTHVLSSDLKHPEAFAEFTSTSKVMRSLFSYVESIAASPEPVLITGETGVGKELMARAVYRVCGLSGDFVSINVAGLDDEAFSDTLFGHRKGAFTGAAEVRAGLIEKAEGGVMFMDEIGDLSMGLQVKLLRLLQEREYFQLGSDVPKSSTARIIVATNLGLEQLRDPKRFRQDLFFRLRRHHVHIPPLRERMEDLPYLLNNIIDRTAARAGKKRPVMHKDLLVLLASHPFPGNIRELESMVHEAVAAHRTGQLSLKVFLRWIEGKAGDADAGGDATPAVIEAAEGVPVGATMIFPGRLPTLRQAQDQLIQEALNRANSNQAVAARLLGVTRQALNRRLGHRKRVETVDCGL